MQQTKLLPWCPENYQSQSVAGSENQDSDTESEQTTVQLEQPDQVEPSSKHRTTKNNLAAVNKREFPRKESFGPCKAFKKYTNTTPKIAQYYTQRFASSWEPKEKQAKVKQTNNAANSKTVQKKHSVTDKIDKDLQERMKFFLVRLR